MLSNFTFGKYLLCCAAMHRKTAQNTPAEWFRQALQQEVVAGKDVRHYLESTFGSTDLKTVFADVESAEIDTLLELLFYPDTPLQLQFEKNWGDTLFSKREQEQLLRRLASGPMRTCIRLEEGGAPVSIEVPVFVRHAFVRRMNIMWQPPDRLRSVLEKQLGENEAMAVRVRLRNTPLAWRPVQCELLCDYFRAFPSGARDFDACLDLLLSVLGELPENQPAYLFLIEKKRSWFQALCNAEAFERRRQNNNMETLMMRGERAAYGDISQLRRQMRLMDALCMALFGRTEFFQSPMEHSEHIELDGDNRSMDSIIAKLS